MENLENSTALEVTGDLYITYLELTGPDAFALYHICIAFWNFHVSGDDHAIFEDVLALFRPSGTLEVRTIRMSFLGAVVFGWGKNSLFFRWCVISPVKKKLSSRQNFVTNSQRPCPTRNHKRPKKKNVWLQCLKKQSSLDYLWGLSGNVGPLWWLY